MRKTCFLCYGNNKDKETFTYSEDPTNLRGEEFFVFFSPPRKESEAAIRKLFRSAIEASRLGDPVHYFQKVIESFRTSVDNLEIDEDIPAESMVVIMIRRERDAYLLCSKGVEILYHDSEKNIEGPVGILHGVKETGPGDRYPQAELFEKNVADYFRIYRFKIPDGCHSLVFAPSREFIGQNIEMLRDNLFFPSTIPENTDMLSFGTDQTFPVMHWDIEKKAKKTAVKQKIRRKSMIRSRAPYITGGIAIIVAIFFIFDPFDISEKNDDIQSKGLLAVQDDDIGETEGGSTKTETTGSDTDKKPPVSEKSPTIVRETKQGELKEAWKEKFESPVTSSPSVLDGQIVFGCRDAFIYSYGTEGTFKWKYKAEGGVGSSPLFSGSRVIGADYAGNIVCLESSSGNMSWIYRGKEKIITTPRLMGDMVIVGTMEGNLISLDIKDGKRIWAEKLGNEIWASPAVSGECIIAGTTDGSLVRLSKTGKIEWRVKPGGGIYSSPLPRGDIDLVFFGSDDKYVYAYSISKGNLMWRFPGGSKMRGKPETDGKNLYIGSEDGMLYAISFAGELVWKADLQGAVRSKPLILDDMIVVTAYNSKTYVLNTGTGKVIFEYDVESPVYSSPATDGSKIFFGSNQGYLHAVSIGRGAL
ncbi:MAG: PQQ-binding-like beta-propeller repeat protein [Candidatus Krumholzibacteriota bacterium]|nr:PQQ-binding-like beta-propeller repeat protein [Candidatus Krumholzibacteriota bacterium]